MKTTETTAVMTLRNLRESKKLSQRAVARKLGFSNVAIVKLEATGNTTTTTLEKYALAIGCPFSQVSAALEETRRRASMLSQ